MGLKFDPVGTREEARGWTSLLSRSGTASNSPLAINMPDPTRLGFGARHAPVEAVWGVWSWALSFTSLYLGILFPRVVCVHIRKGMYSAAAPTLKEKRLPIRFASCIPGVKRSTVGL